MVSLQKSIRSLFLAAATLPGILHAQSALSEQADKLNSQIFSRFIGKHGIMYDYAGLHGEVQLPSKEECEAMKPNALGWWTPIENGGFFNGLYLIEQCRRYVNSKNEKDKEHVRTLVRGLLLLQDAGRTPGFIARGVGSDGQSHYPCSSNDQVYPWYLGLDAYLNTDIPGAEERKEITARLERQTKNLQKNSWILCGDPAQGNPKNFSWGSFRPGDYVTSVHILVITELAARHTGKAEWRKLHEQLRSQKLKNGQTVLQCVEAGPAKMPAWSSWYMAGVQYGVRLLRDAEKNPEIRSAYQRALQKNAKLALPLIRLHRKFKIAGERPRFTPDWRSMMPPWRPQLNAQEARKLAMEQQHIWHSEKSPALGEEKASLMPAASAAWNIVLTGDPGLLEQARPEIMAMLSRVRGKNLYYAASLFYLENTITALLDTQCRSQAQTPPATGRITSDSPSMLFTDGQKLKFKTGGNARALQFKVLDFHDKTADSGTVADDGTFTVKPLPRGYYRMEVNEPGGNVFAIGDFSILPDPARRRMREDSPYAMDVASSVIGTSKNYFPGDREKSLRYFAHLVNLLGVNYARERFHHSMTEPAPGKFNWKFFGDSPEFLHRNGIRVSAANHEFAVWARTKNRQGSLAKDLMTVYQFSKKAAEQFKGKIQAWECWNEPDMASSCADSAWEFAAMSKAAYLGFKDGNPDATVTNGSFCFTPESDIFAKSAMDNDLSGYFDIFNFHIYAPMLRYESVLSGWKKILRQHGAADRAIWITENGTNAEGVAKIPTKYGNNMALSPDQELLWAEFIPKSQIILQNLGVSRTFFFVLPAMNERNGKKDWGLMRRDRTAKPGFAAFATLTDQLGNAECLGEADFGPKIRAFVYAMPDGSQTLAFWSKSELDTKAESSDDGYSVKKLYTETFSVPAHKEAELVNIFGTAVKVPRENGKLELTATRYPAYLRGLSGIPVKRKPTKNGKIGVRENGIDRSLVLRVLGGKEFQLSAGRDLMILHADGKAHKLKMQLANFSGETKSGTVTLQGMEVKGLPLHIELKPMEIRDFEVVIPPQKTKHCDLIFGGEFNGRPISRLFMPLLLIAETRDEELPGSTDSTQWINNSSGTMKVSKDEKENAIRVDVEFPPDVDRWVYPVLPLRNVLPANTYAISFDMKIDQDEKSPASGYFMLVNKDKSKRDLFLQLRVISHGDWKNNFFELQQGTPSGISKIRIGLNPKVNKVTYWIRNVRFHMPK